jgi:hypothetical protein
MFVSRFWLKNIHLVRIYVKTIHFIFFLLPVYDYYLPTLYLKK